MTKEELTNLHRQEMRDHGSSKEHSEVSIQYAISVLEGMQPKHTAPDPYIQAKIEELKKLL